MKKEKPASPPSAEGLRTTVIGIIVSAFLAAAKALAGIFGHSYALVADAIESGADVLTSSLLWWGLKWSGRPADENHPYGHGKAEALIALGIALALVLAAGIIVYQSVLHILRPHHAPAPYTLIVLLAVIVTKELLYRFIRKKGADMNSSAVKADAVHHRSDAITSAAAFVGITIALIGGEGYEVADDYAALLGGGVIFFNAYAIARPAIGELLDETLEGELLQRIKELAEGVMGVRLVEKCRSRKMGVGYHVDLHVWVDGQITVEKGHDIAHLVKDRILANVPQVIDVHIHIEPS